jgi:hypothetical protein
MNYPGGSPATGGMTEWMNAPTFAVLWRLWTGDVAPLGEQCATGCAAGLHPSPLTMVSGSNS